MTRTAAREIAVQLSFELGMNPLSASEVLDSFFESEYYATLATEDELFATAPDETQEAYIRTLVSGVSEHREELDGYIEKYARNWKLSRISKTAVAVLRTALFEILYMDEVPNAAAINEAVELAKGYDEAETVAFVNGILGGFMRDRDGAQEEK